MQLSTKGRYAVMAMTDLAGQAAGRAVSLAEIAERQQLSQAYLEQLFARLRRRGLVQSVRGPGGGYRLTRPAAETSIADVVTAVDEPLKATRCAGHAAMGCMKGGARCLTHDLWEQTGRLIHDYFASISLADVVGGRLPQPSGEGGVMGVIQKEPFLLDGGRAGLEVFAPLVTRVAVMGSSAQLRSSPHHRRHTSTQPSPIEGEGSVVRHLP